MHNLSAKPVQLNLHKDICISFREDSFVVSFGDAKKFYEEDGKGLGKFLDEHAMDYFKNKSMQKVHLRVSPNNDQAVSYYKKMGWKDLGPSANSADVHLMEKIISQ